MPELSVVDKEQRIERTQPDMEILDEQAVGILGA